MNIFNSISIYRKAYRNWLSVLYNMYKIRNKFEDKTNIKLKVILRDSNEVKEATYAIINGFALCKSIQSPKIHNLTISEFMLIFSYDVHQLKFELGNGGDIDATFFKEEYNFLKVAGRDVIDIGSNLGDTAIWFALKGAKKVISLEPYPYTFALAKKNVGMSEFKNKIELINAGYGEDKKIKIDNSFIPDNGSDIRENKNGTEIDLYSLQNLIGKYNIDSGLLKMDCEGCEYNLLNENNETLRKFDRIQIEYHSGYEKLVNKLQQCGFSFNITESNKSHNSKVGKMMSVGYIFAEKGRNQKA